MSAADYRLCDVCGGKAFYDSNLNYENGPSEWNEHLTPYRTAGRPQYDTPEKVQKWGTSLDYLGDWAVICDDCAKTHKCIVVPIGEPPMTDHAARIFELEQSLTEQARLVGMGAEREAALLAKVAELEREVERLRGLSTFMQEQRQDARRYRSLRNQLYAGEVYVGEAEIIFNVIGACPSEAEFDAAIDAIDAAMAREGEVGNG